MYSHCNPRQSRSCRGSTAFADGDIVIDPDRQGSNFAAPCLQHFAIRVQDEMFLKISADGLVTTRCYDRELFGGSGGKLDVEVHRKRSSVERRPKVGRCGRQGESKPGMFRILVFRSHVWECSAGVSPAHWRRDVAATAVRTAASLFCFLQCANHRVQRGIQHDRRSTQLVQLTVTAVFEQIAPVKFHGKVRILQ